jgi:hypothetical protein
MEVEIKNAVIEKALISSGDRGFLDCWLHLTYGGSGQGFGGYALYLPKSWRHHSIESPARHFIFRCMEVAGVTDWDRMSGRTIRVKASNGLIRSIGHIINDDWFSPEIDFADLPKQSTIKEQS